MAVNVKFDLAGNPEPPTIILAKRNGDKLGQLDVNADSIELSDKFNDVSEISFTLNKYINNEITPLWDKVVDFKLVYCPEWDLWFEIKVELDEATETVKTIFCTQLGQAELSQINLYDIHINEEGDPNWNTENKEYKSTILYDPNNTDVSLLHRLLRDKAPHYSIEKVDDTIKNIQRTFSFDGTSIYDAFQEIAEEIGCLFVYNSNSDENGKIKRTISVYDLWQNCNDCGHRGEFTDICPKCGKTNITSGYGEDTLIFVTADELATEGIQLTTDTDSVKNCFKLETGDDVMTATVRNCNPNGTDYIWYFSNAVKEDMSEELVQKINDYNELYKEYYSNYESELDTDLIDKYNALVEKYKDSYNTKSTCLNCQNEEVFTGDCPACGSSNVLSGRYLQSMPYTVKGYSALMNAYYNTIDFDLYLRSGLMPSVETEKLSRCLDCGHEATFKEVCPQCGNKNILSGAKYQASLLTSSSLSPCAVTSVKSVSLATADSAVLSMAKIIVKPTYKVEIKSSQLSGIADGKREWTGTFIITNYSDESDKAATDTDDINTNDNIKVEINDDEETFAKQKIEKLLNKEDTEDVSASGLFKETIKLNANGIHNDPDRECDFCLNLKKYGLNPRLAFRDAAQSCVDILVEQGVSDKKHSLYMDLYMPYYKKLKVIEKEIAVLESEISIITNLQNNIKECQVKIQDVLNFESYLGKDLWLEFCAYRREDKYSNDNYISDGLDNAEMFKKALEFFEVAENEIYKSAELQHSISTSLNNLLAIPKFKELVRYFKTGNWIRVRVDDRIFKLRLLEYDIDFGSFENISVEFSDVVKVKSGITDVKSVIDQASSMATNYSSVQRQAKQGEKSNAVVSSWVENGLDATNTKIVNAVDENLLFDRNGFLCRQYDPITDTYSNEQIKIIGSTIAVTDDNWETTKTAIGKFYYVDPLTNETKVTYGVNGETIVGKLLIGENLAISNDDNSLEFSDDGLTVENKENRVEINPNGESIFNISNIKDNKSILSLDGDGNLVVVGKITALEGSTVDGISVKGLATVATTGKYEDLIDEPTKLSDFTNDKGFVTKSVSNLTNYYNKNAVNNLIDLRASKIEEVLYTEFDQVRGWYDESGTIVEESSRVHSQMLPINGDTDYYIGYLLSEIDSSYTCTGAFFDIAGNLISPLLTENISQYIYDSPNGNSSSLTNYVKLYTFKSPSNACYFSYNLAVVNERKYRQYISSKPIFMLANTGNYIIYEGDPIYQNKKNKNLCVVGASGVMIDRRYNEKVDGEYIVGFQEYLSLWYKNVHSYGYSGGSWAEYNESTQSIYSGITSVNLSSYDEFLLLPSTGGITHTDVGEIDSNDTSNYMGGLNSVIEYIYSQVPLAKIYLVNLLYKGDYYNKSNTRTMMDEVNTKLVDFSDFNSCQLIDIAGNIGCNSYTYNALTYDGKHLNQEGNKLQGLFIRREIIGI